MSADLGLAAAHPGLLAGRHRRAAGWQRSISLFGLALAARQTVPEAIRFSLALPQASEFSFVLFGAAVAVGALAPGDAAMATLVAAVSMAATPVLFALSERFLIPLLRSRSRNRISTPSRRRMRRSSSAGSAASGRSSAACCGCAGSRSPRWSATSGQVDVVRRFGNKVYFGDPTRADLLRAAGAEQAKLLIVALDHAEDALRVVEVAKRNFPQLKIFARARNRRHAHLLMDRGVDGLVRDTFYSSLKMAEDVLEALGVSHEDANRSVELFREHDERNLLESHAIYRDEKQLIQSVQQATEELATLFEADRRE